MEDIQDVLARRGIPALYHFTRNANLSHILEHGLLSRNEIAARGIDAHVSDQLRLDGHLNAISVSIGFPNYRMFYSLRCATNQEWAVIAFKPELLSMCDCCFYPTNAAASAMAALPPDTRRGCSALEEMFASPAPCGVERDAAIGSHLPTDPQAEVMVLEPIDPMFIDGIYFQSDYWLKRAIEQQAALAERAGVDPRLFSYRSDYESWQGH
jgi:hypothetical protein